MTEELLANAYIKGASDLLQGNIDGMTKVVVIPDNATNGEVIKAMFPNVQIREVCRCELIEFTLDGVVGTTATKDWWNAPYKIDN